MSITFTSVTIVGPPTGARQPCADGRFALRVEVAGNASAAGARYAVIIRSKGAAGEERLDSVTELPPPGPFAIVTTLPLVCDSQCHVAGALGSAGMPDAEIHAVVKEQLVADPASLASEPIVLHCGDAAGEAQVEASVAELA